MRDVLEQLCQGFQKEFAPVGAACGGGDVLVYLGTHLKRAAGAAEAVVLVVVGETTTTVVLVVVGETTTTVVLLLRS